MKGAALGIGRYLYRDGLYFEGHFNHNMAHGEGKCISKDFQFIGNWKLSKPTRGKYTLPSGLVIIIEEDHKGRIIYPNKTEYNGDLNDELQLHGFGTKIYSDGSSYVGEWKMGKRHGKGKFTWKNG